MTKSNEGTTRGDTSHFHSFIPHLVKYIEVVKNLTGFLPNPLPSIISDISLFLLLYEEQFFFIIN